MNTIQRKNSLYRRSAAHYQKMVRFRIASNKRTFEDRFWKRTDQSNGPDSCWPWTGFKAREVGGYGILYSGKIVFAHRVAWTLKNGAIPKGLCICHHCDNPPCCNPKHLFMGTRKENNQDCAKKGRHSTSMIGKFGESACNVKLTERQAKDVIRRRKKGELYSRMAKHFGVDQSTLQHIATGRSWPHLKR